MRATSMADLAASTPSTRRRLDYRTRATDEAGRLLVDAVGRDFCLNVLERGVEFLGVLERLMDMQHAHASIEIGGNLAVDGAADLCGTRRWRKVASPHAA